jgi:predicted dinucleotide-binding enzyme
VKVAVVGGGKMGSGIAKLLTPTHEVRIGSRDRERGAALASQLGAASGGTYADAVGGAEVVFLAIPWLSVEETLRMLGDLAGKVIVDITNPYVDGKVKLHDGSSNAEEIQKLAPTARVVKGWNTVFSQVLADGPDFGGEAASVFLASDDAQAKETVAALARDMGFDPIDCGPLTSARSLERLLTTFGAVGRSFEYGRWTLRVLRR